LDPFVCLTASPGAGVLRVAQRIHGANDFSHIALVAAVGEVVVEDLILGACSRNRIGDKGEPWGRPACGRPWTSDTCPLIWMVAVHIALVAAVGEVVVEDLILGACSRE
jgi:hypothetical protein